MDRFIGYPVFSEWAGQSTIYSFNGPISTKLVALMYTAWDTKLKKIFMPISAKTGTPNSMYLAVHEDNSNGEPDATPLYSGTFNVTFPSAKDMLEIDVEAMLSGVTFTVDKPYWFVFGNPHATPTTNYWSIIGGSTNQVPLFAHGYNKSGINAGVRTWNGTIWSSPSAANCIGFEWANGIGYTTVTIGGIGYDVPFFARVGLRESGVEVTLPDNHSPVRISAFSVKSASYNPQSGFAIYVNKTLIEAFPYNPPTINTDYIIATGIFKVLSKVLILYPGDTIAVMTHDTRVDENTGYLNGQSCVPEKKWIPYRSAWKNYRGTIRTAAGEWTPHPTSVPNLVLYGTYYDPYVKEQNRRQFFNAR